MSLWTIRTRPLEGEELWRAEKRDEAARLFRAERHQWIKAGAFPAPRYGSKPDA